MMSIGIRQGMLAILAIALASPAVAQTAAANVSPGEFAGYQLVYQLDISASPNYSLPIPYGTDNAAALAGTPYDRIAYYVELQPATGPRQWVWVSVDAFTQNPTLIGVPGQSVPSIFWQQILTNMNVESNVGSVATGTGITTGNIEFWHRNYGTANSAGIPGASSAVYDFGDTAAFAGNHGSMQIHNYGAQRTIFGMSHFNRGLEVEIGIGPNSGPGQPDWTFNQNGNDYTFRNLEIYVRTDGDGDGDGVLDAGDNCVATANADQSDLDGDGEGDACDEDDDGDGVPDAGDNCALTANADQTDTDGDGIGDACDADDDGDGVPDAGDNCALTANSDQTDTDGDGAGDACDADDDGDGVLDAGDNCALTPNPDQTDTDGDGAGDACDADDDGDGVLDAADQCPGTASGQLIDPATGCSIAQLCSANATWKNHGAYVSCVAAVTTDFVRLGLITPKQRAATVSSAARSSVGKP